MSVQNQHQIGHEPYDAPNSWWQVLSRYQPRWLWWWWWAFHWTYYQFFSFGDAYLIDGSNARPVMLTMRTQMTHDTIRLVFSFPSRQSLGITCGQHIWCHLGDHKRAYTPTTHADGQFELVVKRVPDGIVSGYLHQMAIGHTLLISGPAGRCSYRGGGVFTLSVYKAPEMTMLTSHVLCVCAGSGITPIYAVLKHVACVDVDMKVKVLYVNKTVDDVILRTELDEMCENHQNVECHYTLTQPPPEWTGLVGRPSIDMIAGIANTARNEVVLVCGSVSFNRCIAESCLKLGYERRMLVLF